MIDGIGENRTLVRGLHPILAVTAEIVSLLGMFGFVIGVWLNVIVFQHWNIPFLMVATPADVLMSSLQILYFFLPGAIFAILLFGLHGPTVRFFGFDRLPIVILTALVNIVLLANCIGYLFFLDWYTQHVMPSGTQFGWVGLSISVGLALHRLRSRIPEIDQQTRFQARALVVLAAILTISGIYDTARTIAREGYFTERSTPTITTPVVADCPRAVVMWSGDRSIVASCGSDRMIVLHESQNLNYSIPKRSPVVIIQNDRP